MSPVEDFPSNGLRKLSRSSDCCSESTTYVVKGKVAIRSKTMASRGNTNGWQGGSLLGITHEPLQVRGHKRKQDSQQMALPESETTIDGVLATVACKAASREIC
jgi:hypothetical protein